MSWHALALSSLAVLRDWFLNPLLYAGFVLAFWDLRRTSTFERKFFGIRATRPLRLTIIRGLQGLLVGIVISALLTASGVVVALWEIAAVTAVSIVLAAIQLRFVSPVYAVALLAGAAWATKQWVPSETGFLGVITEHLRSFHLVAWSSLLCGVLVAEAVLLFTTGKHSASPVVTASKRGRGIGALWVPLAFMVPLVVPTSGSLFGSPVYAHSDWHFLWTSGLTAFGMLGLPVLVGFSGLFDNLHPRVGIRATASTDVIAAVIAAAGAYFGFRYSPGYAALAPWVALVVREGSKWWLDHRQSLSDPLFAPADEGVVVLSVLAKSWAARLEIQPGDTITRVNGVPVHSMYDLHFALSQNPAYAKFEVLDARGEVRFVNHTVYEGERTQLGLIFAPDGQSPRFLKARGSGLLQSLYARLTESSLPMTSSVGKSALGFPRTTDVAPGSDLERTSNDVQASKDVQANSAGRTSNDVHANDAVHTSGLPNEDNVSTSSSV